MRPSPALVVALIALFVSIGGVGYAASQITTGDIKNGAVTNKKLHKNAVRTKKIKKKAVKTGKIANLAVKTPKLDDQSVTTDKINDAAVTTDKINDAAVTSSKLDSGAVNAASLGTIVARVSEIPLAANGNNADTVFCQPGERLVGGGAKSASFNAWVVSSRPVKADGSDPADGEDDLNGWRAAAHNDTATATTFKIFAMCLQ
jgi:hypothetical protein